MARSTTHISLNVWDQTTDPFNHTQLAANWDLIDSYFASFDTTTKLPTTFQSSATVPAASGTPGRFVVLSAATGGYNAYTLLKYDGTSWLPVGYEILGAVPTSGNFAGRIVVLSSASSPFNAWDVIRYDGSAWSIVGGFTSVNTGAGTSHIQGLQTANDVYITTGTRGLVLTDRTTGLHYRVYIDSAAWRLEAVT